MYLWCVWCGVMWCVGWCGVVWCVWWYGVVVYPPYRCICKFAPVLLELFEPKIFHISKADSAHNTEGDQENVCFVIGQHSYPVKILLSSSVPKTA